MADELGGALRRAELRPEYGVLRAIYKQLDFELAVIQNAMDELGNSETGDRLTPETRSQLKATAASYGVDVEAPLGADYFAALQSLRESLTSVSVKLPEPEDAPKKKKPSQKKAGEDKGTHPLREEVEKRVEEVDNVMRLLGQLHERGLLPKNKKATLGERDGDEALLAAVIAARRKFMQEALLSGAGQGAP